MKTTLILALLVSLRAAAQAQDFRTLPSGQQPNPTELAYFGGQQPRAFPSQVSDSTVVRLVLDFLINLQNGQLEAAHSQLAPDFRAFYPGYADSLEANDLLNQWDRNRNLFSDQYLAIESTKSVLITAGDRWGQWVYLKAIWSAQYNRQRHTPISIPFYELVQVRHGKIYRTYTSYGTDQLFYDLGFPLYANGADLTQKR